MTELDGRLEMKQRPTTDPCIAVNAMALKPVLYQRRMDICPMAISRGEPSKCEFRY